MTVLDPPYAWESGSGRNERLAFSPCHLYTVRDILNGTKHVHLAVLHALTVGVGLNRIVAPKLSTAPPLKATRRDRL